MAPGAPVLFQATVTDALASAGASFTNKHEISRATRNAGINFVTLWFHQTKHGTSLLPVGYTQSIYKYV